MITEQQILEKIHAAFPGATAKARDLTGGGDHWQLAITAKEFEGLALVKQHQLVYKALGTWVHKEIHALTLDLKAPE